MSSHENWNVNTENGIVVISSVDGKHSCQIYLYGATITSWINRGKEKLFLSKTAVLNKTKAIRGGIPVVFPVFGQSDVMPQHGFARISDWELLFSESSADDVTAILTLRPNEATLKSWPHHFQLQYKLQLSMSSLKCVLSMKNVDSKPFSCHSLLHTYLCIPDVHKLTIEGYQDNNYIDKLKDNGTFSQIDNPIQIVGEIDRIYVNSTSNIKLSLLSSIDAFLEVEKKAHLETEAGEVPVDVDCVLWNPWIEKSKTLADLDNEGYLNFVCVEPGTVCKFVEVLPGCTLHLTQTLVSFC